jgi:methylenetetrahydrofolate dehydrogenase (NADP+)/methenyltetrahydrofolate cyclohydrolase
MIVDGEKIAKGIKNNLRKMIKEKNIQKRMAIFYVGDNKVIEKFIKLKKKFGKSLGIETAVFNYDSNISEKELIKDIKVKVKDFDGAIVQLPLPKYMDKKKVLNSIPKEKDIDVLGDKRYKDFASGDFTFFPPVAGAVFEIFSYHKVKLDDKNIVVVGDGILVGGPVRDWLLASGLNPVVITKDSKDKKPILKNADIIISGAGSPNLIKKSFVKKGSVLIDAGASSEDGKIVGDISKECAQISELFAGVPGGVGPITIAILFRNLIHS